LTQWETSCVDLLECAAKAAMGELASGDTQAERPCFTR